MLLLHCTTDFFLFPRFFWFSYKTSAV